MSTATPHQLPSPILEVSENASPIINGENSFSVLQPSSPLAPHEPSRPLSAGSESSSRSSSSSNEVVVVEPAREGEEEAEEVEEVQAVVEEEKTEEKKEDQEEEEQKKSSLEIKEQKQGGNSQDKDIPNHQQKKSEPHITIPPVAAVPEPEDQETEEYEGSEITPLTTLEPKAITTPEQPVASSKAAEAAAHATEKLTSRLPECLAKANSFISRFNRLMSTAHGTDRVLMTTSYTLTAVTAQLDRISQYRALAYANANSQKVSILPIGFLGYLLFSRRPEASRLSAFSAHLKALASRIADVRIFVRLWGLFGMYEWLVSTLRDPPKDITLRKITYLQIAVNILYQILENLAYLGQNRVLPIGKKRQNSYWLWSSRFWMAHVVLEFWRLKRDRELSLKSISKGADATNSGGFEPKWYDVAGVMKSDEKKSVWLKQLWSNMAYAPLTVHWSLENGALSPLSVGTFGTIAGIIGLHTAWRRAAS